MIAAAELQEEECARPIGRRAPAIEKKFGLLVQKPSDSVGGTSRPSALAVVRLMTRSNFLGCSTGISAGFAPRSILSTKSAARRNRSGSWFHRTSDLPLRRLPRAVHRRQPRRRCQGIDPDAVGAYERVDTDIKVRPRGY
jgi:hypothetical protein